MIPGLFFYWQRIPRPALFGKMRKRWEESVGKMGGLFVAAGAEKRDNEGVKRRWQCCISLTTQTPMEAVKMASM